VTLPPSKGKRPRPTQCDIPHLRCFHHLGVIQLRSPLHQEVTRLPSSSFCGTIESVLRNPNSPLPCHASPVSQDWPRRHIKGNNGPTFDSGGQISHAAKSQPRVAQDVRRRFGCACRGFSCPCWAQPRRQRFVQDCATLVQVIAWGPVLMSDEFVKACASFAVHPRTNAVDVRDRGRLGMQWQRAKFVRGCKLDRTRFPRDGVCSI
jgi:hypothetical protein